ncbi:MAG: glycosyltransferase family 4 protein [Verrucomicrobiota bacterium]|nr:glycosyltransferase family 4 protein [Verrucomicrobiota bacterium]
MILLAHPFGNANVRAVLESLQEVGRLAKFVTALGWSSGSPLLRALPARLRGSLARRSYELPNRKIEVHAAREVVRLLAGVSRARTLIEHEHGWASIDRVWQRLDAAATAWLCANKAKENVTAVYAYEDCALRLFENARVLGVHRIYDLPIAYYETSQRLLREEAERYPDWEPTLGGTRDSAGKLARKRRELELAELVICPSNFVLESLPESARATKHCVMVPFGSPAAPPPVRQARSREQRLRVLFAGALTQRKGLADLFAAIKLVASARVELVVMGSALMPLSWYRGRAPLFTYEAPRPHAAVLRLMQSCDVFVLPSIVEGRALVQQEAMACGLPLIVTRNAGADDLVDEGATGFLVPIRAPEAIAEKISWCATHRESLPGMAIAAQERAAELTWRGYGQTVLAAIQNLTGP